MHPGVDECTQPKPRYGSCLLLDKHKQPHGSCQALFIGIPPTLSERIEHVRQAGAVVADDLFGRVAEHEPHPADTLIGLVSWEDEEVAVIARHDLCDCVVLVE